MRELDARYVNNYNVSLIGNLRQIQAAGIDLFYSRRQRNGLAKAVVERYVFTKVIAGSVNSRQKFNATKYPLKWKTTE